MNLDFDTQLAIAMQMPIEVLKQALEAKCEPKQMSEEEELGEWMKQEIIRLGILKKPA